jgi:tRNA-intron endonuclease
MKITGKLSKNKIIVKKPKDVGRLFNKSHFGNPIKNNTLELNLLEGVFLLGENKIKIMENNREINFENLIKLAASKVFDFEIKYLSYRDLRKRGHIIGLSNEDQYGTFTKKEIKNTESTQKTYILTYSERDFLDINFLHDLLQKLNQNNLWILIVDEEGDITYYDVEKKPLNGFVKEGKYKKGKGFLLKNRVLIFEKDLSKKLHKEEFFGKSFAEGLQLSIVEALHLSQKDILDIFTIENKSLSKKEFYKISKKLQPDIDLRVKIYEDLKSKNMILKTGFKFCCHFFEIL